MQWLVYVAFGIHAIVSIALIALVISQTTKHEGLGGSIGGGASQSFRGRPGVDDQLSRYTGWAAVGFMVMSLVVYQLVERFL